jgi:hypothetical protein
MVGTAQVRLSAYPTTSYRKGLPPVTAMVAPDT